MFKNDSDYLDQHFLVDDNIINKFISICNLKKDDVVVEIGPGIGTLTKIIASKVNDLTVIEKDTRLKEYLDKINNIKIIYGSVLDIKIPKCDKIITSLPYSIIEPFIYKLVNTDFREVYMIMGSNYIESVLSKEISNLSLLTNTFFDVEKYFDVKPNSFNPAPRTLSGVVKITKKKDFKKIDLFFKNMYLLDDKKIKNALMESFILINGLTKRESKSIVNSLGLSEPLLNNKFNLISNDELKELYKMVYSVL